jgi:2-keto-4-pentenoate hydratase
MSVENASPRSFLRRRLLARRLRIAYKGQPIDSLRAAIPDQERAYAVQETNTRFWLAEGRRMVGRKIGLTSPAVQAQLGVDEPDFGILFADMQVGNESTVSLGSLIQPRVEAEVAFVLKDDLAGDITGTGDILAAIDYAAPAIEIVDSRIRGWRINICDTIADNASSGLFLLGDHHFSPAEVDLASVTACLYLDGILTSEGSGADCLGNPLSAVLWLARKLKSVGRPLEAGDIVLSGALGKMASVESPGEFQARFDGLGTVSVRFEQDD